MMGFMGGMMDFATGMAAPVPAPVQSMMPSALQKITNPAPFALAGVVGKQKAAAMMDPMQIAPNTAGTMLGQNGPVTPQQG